MEKPKVAVIGSGISGLTAAYLLASKYDVSIFERTKAVGMDAHSVTAFNARIDVPLRVFSAGFYPNLLKLYKHLDVKFAPASYAFSLTKLGSTAYFRFFSIYFGTVCAEFCFVALYLHCLNYFLKKK